MQPYYYQQTMIDEVIEKFKTKDKIMAQLATAGGKTVIFSFLIKWWLENHTTNVLILCHRTELISQSEETLNNIGIGSEPIIAKHKTAKHHSRVYIGMIETANKRLQKNPYFFSNIGLIITDEAHILVFNKVYNYFPNAKILGCTATPCVMKRITFYKCIYCRNDYDEQEECCGEETAEYSKPFTLSQIYDDIVVGPSIQELIAFGSVVSEISFIKHYTDDASLKVDSDGEFTTESVDKEYGSDNAVFNVLLNYKELCIGKKTIIFNSSAKTNLIIYDKFISEGFTNVRMFDSINKEQSGNRAELLKWFDETADAILLNVGIFTTGFDSKEVEAIILNRPTGSLSLFIQIAGRGGRASTKIYKDNFIFIDGGGNIDRFGEWSSPDRDWRKIFFEGTTKERAKVLNSMDIHDCPQCGALYPKSAPECPECGTQIEASERRQSEKQESEDVLVPIRKIPPPNAERIYKYTVSQNEDINFAFKLMINHICDMFRYYRVTKDTYQKTMKNGKLDARIRKMIQNCYFVFLKKPDIQTSGRRKLETLIDRTKAQLEKYYA